MTEKYVEELIQKLAEGTASDTEIKILNDWYRATLPPEVWWQGSDEFEKQRVSQRIHRRLRDQIIKKPARVVGFPWFKAAAILFIFLGVASVLTYIIKPRSEYITITNPSQNIRLVTLPDNSKVWLNGSTTLSYVKSFPVNRNLNLSGEAYFEVTHDPGHPFTVTTGGLTTTVKGTHFNIQSYKQSDLTTVSLLSGKVVIGNSSKELVELTAATQYQYHRSNTSGKVNAIDTARVIAWKKGLLQFDGEPFSEMAVVLENWYNTKINFSDPGLLSCRFYLSVENTTSLPDLLSTLSRITEIDYRFNQDSSIVSISGKGCN